jgi:general secretion pathway protein K
VSRDERGWALVSVLWVVSMLAMLAAATQVLTVTSWKTESRAYRATQAQALLDAAVAQAAAGIASPNINDRWPVDGTARDVRFDGNPIKVAVQDELGRIDLNMADGSLISQLLAATGMDLDKAQALTDKILDWRDSSGLRRLHGATVADYQAAGYSYHPRGGPFRRVDELNLVMDMTPALYARIAPALTVYSHSPSLDANTAPRLALLALYNGNTGRLQTALTERQSGSPSGDLKGVIPLDVSLAGRAFTIDAELTLDRKRFTRKEVIELTGNPKHPYLVMFYE